ncbi:hypothetical protein CRUP_034641, partial [Coryphaenoides rupestris]
SPWTSTSSDHPPPKDAGGPPVADDGTYCAVAQAGETEMVAEESYAVNFTHTLTAPAGGALVDACCVSGPSGGLCVVAAGKWAPVISVSSVPDAAGLLCVTLGQLEIREVRVLSCSSLAEVLLCQGVVQAVVGVARSRVVCSSHSTAISTLQLFMLSEDGSGPAPAQPLTSPGRRIGALAAGALFVLLQHQYLGSIAPEEAHQSYHQGDQQGGHNDHKNNNNNNDVVSVETEREKQKTTTTTLFSIVAINPLNGKSVVAYRLHQPEAWSGRLCEADVLGSRLVALSQTGGVCVWDLDDPRGPRVWPWAPEVDGGWQVARWGQSDVLVTGHQNGDLSLYCYHDHHHHHHDQTAVT